MHRSTLAALAATAVAAAAAPATAGAVTITSGTLTDQLGAPTTGEVRVYALTNEEGRQPLLGTATAAPDGRFTVTADDAAVWRLAKGNREMLDWVAEASTGGFAGMDGRTSLVRRAPSGAVTLVEPTAGATAPHAIGGAAPKPIAIRATRLDKTAHQDSPSEDPGRAWECNRHDWETKEVGEVRKLVTVGELNNAWNDGTRARFEYGTNRESATWFRWGWDLDLSDSVGLSFAGQNERLFRQGGTVEFPVFDRRLSRKLKTRFVFKKYVRRVNKCAPWSQSYIKPTAWIAPSEDISQRVSGGLDQCKAGAFGRGGLPGGVFASRNTRAQSWEVSLGGSLGQPAGSGGRLSATVGARSGFDETVRISYRFGRAKSHVLCGPDDDGTQPALEAKRIVAGTAKAKS